MKENNYLQFKDRRLLLFDKRLSGIQLPQKLRADYLFVAGPGNPDADLDFINKNYDYSSLVVDNVIQTT
jgi:hypothetical protein